MRSKIYRLYIYRLYLIHDCLPCIRYLTVCSRCGCPVTSRKPVYLCDYALINLFSNDFQTSLNTNPDPFIYLLLLLHQTNLCAKGISGTATISWKHLVNWSTLQRRWRNLIKWCLSLNVASVQTFSAHWHHPFIIHSALAGQAKGQRSSSLFNC